jgi:hypothetical protein
LDSTKDGLNDAAELSALVIPARGKLKAFPSADLVPAADLMHSYHIVAELRQFRGVSNPHFALQRH